MLDSPIVAMSVQPIDLYLSGFVTNLVNIILAFLLQNSHVLELLSQMIQHESIDVLQTDPRSAETQAGLMNIKGGLVQLRLRRCKSAAKQEAT